MPADGRRKKILVGTRDAIKAATGAAYFNDYSGAKICELGKETEPSMLEGPRLLMIRIWDGAERTTVDGGIEHTASLEVLVVVAVRDSVGTLVERLSDVIADLTLAIGTNPSLGGICTHFRIQSIDPPDYDEETTAYTTVRVLATYQYTAGVDR